MSPESYDLEDLGVACTLKSCNNTVVLHLSTGLVVEGRLSYEGSLSSMLNTMSEDFFILAHAKCLNGTYCNSGMNMVVNKKQVVLIEVSESDLA